MKSVVLASVLLAATGAAALAATFKATASGTLCASVDTGLAFQPPVTYEFDTDFTVDDAAGPSNSPVTGASGTRTTDRFGT